MIRGKYNSRLKEFVRIDGQNKIVPSSNILREHMPKSGKWREILKSVCCITTIYPYITTTTTTTSFEGDGELLTNELGDILVTNETGESLILNEI